MKTLVLNLFGGPGTGKSTTAAGVFHRLKLQGVNCELALEYAKDKVWEDSGHILDNQLHVFGEQFHRVWRLLGKVDVVITDGPLLNSILFYRDENPHFAEMVSFEHSRLNNLDVLLERTKEYNPLGRLETEKDARALDDQIRGILDKRSPCYININADEHAVDQIFDQVVRILTNLAT